MANAFERFGKKIKTAFSRANDKNDSTALRLNNEGLLLVKDEVSDKFKIWVVVSKKNLLWIYNNINHRNHSEYDKFAVSLLGEEMPVELVKHGKGLKSYTTYNHNGKELDTLFAHSNKSQRLFWTIKKFNILNAFDGDDKLTYDSLKNLEEMINEEYQYEDNKTDNETNLDNNIISDSDIEKAYDEAIEEYNQKRFKIDDRQFFQEDTKSNMNNDEEENSL